MEAPTTVDRVPFSLAPTLVGEPATTDDVKLESGPLPEPTAQPLSTARKYSLLVLFCLAQFIDTFNNSALFSAIPSIKEATHMTESESTWLISAFQLTFASFLLMSGRISDVYNPKIAFIVGIAALGVFSIIAGFLNAKIGLIILRALSGMVGALTIPSALSLIVHVFPDAEEQARAIAFFGGTGAIGNVIGLLIGAIFVQLASWRWVFWFVGIVSIPIAAVCLVLVPRTEAVEVRTDRFKSLDVPGVSVLTSALVLFIFAVTSSTSSGWGSAMVLAPLIISLALIGGFFFWEAVVPENRAAIPPKTWFYPNFSALFGLGLLPYFWWTTIFTIFTLLWQQVYGWSAIMTAVHMLPLGISAFAMVPTSRLAQRIEPKWLILTGITATTIGTILLAFADSPSRYWPFVFPAFVLGSAGTMLTYTHTNIAIFRATPPEIAGIVGACFNGALQLGSAVGIAAVTSIQTSIEDKKAEGFASYAGRRAAFWFLLAVVIAEGISVVVFYRPGRAAARTPATSPSASTNEKSIGDPETMSQIA